MSDSAYHLAEKDYKKYQKEVLKIYHFCGEWKDNTAFVVADFEEDQKLMITEDEKDDTSSSASETSKEIKSPIPESPVAKKRCIDGIDERIEAEIKKGEENAVAINE